MRLDVLDVPKISANAVCCNQGLLIHRFWVTPGQEGDESDKKSYRMRVRDF